MSRDDLEIIVAPVGLAILVIVVGVFLPVILELLIGAASAVAVYGMIRQCRDRVVREKPQHERFSPLFGVPVHRFAEDGYARSLASGFLLMIAFAVAVSIVLHEALGR